MKKIYFLVLFVLMLSSAVKAQTGWTTINLDEKVSVKFPAEPQKATKNGFDVYTLIGTDSVAYSAAMVDYKVIVHLDSAALAPMKDTQQFADQMKIGIASQKKNYSFENITIGKWKTYTSYLLPATDNTNKNRLFIQMILIGSKMYTLSCRVPAHLVSSNKETFLGSPEILKK